MKKYLLGLSFLLICYPSFAQITLQDYLVKKLDQSNFSKSAEKIAREAAGNFLKLYNSEKFKEAYSYDPIMHTYTIKSDVLPYDLKYLEWGGSSKVIGTNIMGKFTSTDIKDYNSLIAKWLNEYIAQYPSSSPTTTPYIVELKFPELFQYIARIYYNDNKDLCISKWREIKSREEKASTLIKYLKEEIDLYISDYSDRDKANSNLTRFNTINKYIDIDKAFDLKKAIDSKDWNNVEIAFNKFGWSLSTYIY